ncbi:DUF4435 domain-containing protein [Enterobacter bugandensis]|uniref:DUF4435 domain-containing protein n=1 Tax=Enterobacter bugandensis TaxID=881260 RepID=UPI00200474CF|nr:DUF4435 domain-containing protein [Enterobacter bugandensis]MCK7396593.1 DUF4435 domain-containing protein [Enterobacter bugandensis]
MVDFHYSADAENIMNLFYQAEVMVYVEGPDDICFWETVFDKVSDLKVEIQDVGGCEELKKYIERIINEDLNIIIACDADFTTFSNQMLDRRIIKTPGHSIENTFINENGVYKAIKTLGKLSQKTMSEINIISWQDDFYSKMEPLIKLDIYNFIYNKGIPVIGDNADRFMKSKKSNAICEQKIKSYSESTLVKLGAINLEEIDAALPQPIDYSRWIRGHFLFSAIHRLVSTMAEKSGKNISLSYESLYSNLMNSFESNFTEAHNDFNHYREKINTLQI